MTSQHKSRRPTAESILVAALDDTQWRLHAADDFLLALGEIIAPTDYAVCHFWDPWHPQFFGQRGALLHAINRGISQYPRQASINDRLEWLCKTWQYGWQGELDTLRYHHIHQDLKDLQTRLGSLSATEADTLCRTVFDTYGAEDTDIDDGDFFLEQLGYQLSERGDETFTRGGMHSCGTTKAK